MTVALLIIHDGRHDYLERTMQSARTMLPMDAFEEVITIDDTSHSLGFAGAIQAGWRQITSDYIFHLEGDFTFNMPVDVASMQRVLESQPDVAQLVLKRQPWNPHEIAAGGIVEQHPGDYDEIQTGEPALPTITTHRRFWSTNPCLYSARFCARGWPQESESEGKFTHRLIGEDPDLRFAFVGTKFEAPRVHHIGDVRAGTGY